MNREQHNQMINDRKPETFGDIVSYLRSKRNCRVNGKGFIIINLHDYLDKINESIELIPKDQRKTNLMCKTTKRNLEKVFDAFIEGNVDPVGTIKPKNYGSIYGT